MSTAYIAGKDRIVNVEDADLRWALLTGNFFDDTDTTVAQVTGSSTEVSVSGYARIALSGQVRTTGGTITYDADDPDFSGMSAGETTASILLYEHVTNDSDSIPIAMEVFPSDLPTESVTTVIIQTVIANLVDATP